MSNWRECFHIVYESVKTYCSIRDIDIANAIHVGTASVRQYSGKRKSMPDNIDDLCRLFRTEIEKLNDIEKQVLLEDIQKNLPNN